MWGFKLRSLRFQGKHFTHQAAPDNVNSQHPLGTASIQPRSQERKASQGFCLTLIHPLFRIATPPHPTIALVLLTVLCDSAGLHPTILHPPLPMCLPLCPAVRSGPVRSVPVPGCRGPVRLTGAPGICIPLPGAVQISPAILLTNPYQRCPWRSLWRLCSFLLALNRLALHSAWLVHTDS